MSLPQSPSAPVYDWESDSDCEYTTVPPPAFIARSRVDEVLDQPHQTQFCRALSNVLCSEVAETTFAQLVDGLPLRSVADFIPGLRLEQPVIEHETLCQGALDTARAFRDNFDPVGLDLPVDVLERYQGIPAGSRASKLPLVELVAVSIHRIAVLLYQQGSFHKQKGLPVDEGRLCYGFPNGPDPEYYPTPFCLHGYAHPEQYPDGVADISGYWAENCIFGGVVVFSRGESGTECNDVWLHSFRQDTTRRVWALTDEQVSTLVSFLRSGPQECSKSALPILMQKANQRRVDPDNCIPEHNIYRDRWERKMRFNCRSNWEFAQRGNCVDDEIHYPLRDDDADLV